MHERIPVRVAAADPVSEAGVAAQLRGRPEVLVVEDDGRSELARVSVVIAEVVDDEAVRSIRGLARAGSTVVVVATSLDEGGVSMAVEAGATSLIRRAEATPEHLARTIELAAQGEGTLPPDLLGRFMRQVRHLHQHVLAPRGMHLSGMAEREIEVLRLVADGFSTAEIADELAYSERTIKNILHDVTVRFRLRNRSHAVAYAVRCGLI